MTLCYDGRKNQNFLPFKEGSLSQIDKIAYILRWIEAFEPINFKFFF